MLLSHNLCHQPGDTVIIPSDGEQGRKKRSARRKKNVESNRGKGSWWCHMKMYKPGGDNLHTKTCIFICINTLSYSHEVF